MTCPLFRCSFSDAGRIGLGAQVGWSDRFGNLGRVCFIELLLKRIRWFGS